jgi:hypothetical protein
MGYTACRSRDTSLASTYGIACGLRLFVLLLADNVFYKRLVNESAAGPLTRSDLDVSTIWDNSNFWVDVCAAFKDDNYLIPPHLQLIILFSLTEQQISPMISRLACPNGLPQENYRRRIPLLSTCLSQTEPILTDLATTISIQKKAWQCLITIIVRGTKIVAF